MIRFPDARTANSTAVAPADRIAALEAVFGRDRLAMGTRGFWQRNPDAGASVSASPASRFYLRNCLGIQGVLNFEEYFRIWARSFFETRRDAESAHAVLLVFLHENLAALKDLFILDRPANRAVEANAEAVRRCVEAPEHAALFEGEAFARWVLEEWLPFHLHTLYRMDGAAAAQFAEESIEESVADCAAK